MKVKGLNGLNGLISLGVTWSIPDPYRYVMFIFNFSAVSCKEAVEVILGSPLMGQFWEMEAVWMLSSTEEIKSEPVLLRFEQFVMVGNDNPSLLRCPEKKREYADVVQLYLHQYWAEVVHDAPYCVAVQSKAGQMPLGV
ncbi:hypothetical protein T4D_8176 [Trichinella pseudospiralis]|uniref:Uncharacterized protein n=1 Tax=Trichinella pseudospiralis TaxID=6337 RepID=A0A0V1F566_TRIPS|nr:hypothetical protein T4D_8176 [Trichinella pseudospiralis]